jgi:hypothetical protein
MRKDPSQGLPDRFSAGIAAPFLHRKIWLSVYDVGGSRIGARREIIFRLATRQTTCIFTNVAKVGQAKRQLHFCPHLHRLRARFRPMSKPKPAPKPKRPAAAPKARQRVFRRPRNSLTVALVTAALRESSGIQAYAAEMLKVDRATITKFIHAHPEMADVKAEIEEATNDLAEGVVLASLKSSNENVALSAARYHLDHKARDRGYGPKPIELGGIGGAPILTESCDMSKLTDAQLAALAALDDGTD